MHTMRIRPALGPHPQSTRHPMPGACRLYGDSELFVAFLAGLLLAACTLLPFLPR
ncbi:hypothetical protein [Dyella sp. 2RAB6]|uniref:hypothetical protein n=1 Tax=Dyella sp. 2RAB6 TaxID=3232992 RepID=UPI003F939892